MNYLRTFYPQSDSVSTTIHYAQGSDMDQCSFGLSGDSLINFSLSSGVLKVNDLFFSSLQKNEKVKLDICGSGNNVTIWRDGLPVNSPISTGFSFNSIFYSGTSSGASFSESVFGKQPGINHWLTPWNNSLKSGNIVIYNSGSHNLIINSLSLKDVYAQPTATTLTLSGNSSGYIPLTYSGFSNFSGLGRFVLETNAGEYIFQKDFQTNPTRSYRLIDVSFDSSIGYPSGETNFFIENNGNQDETVEIFFNIVKKQKYDSGSGSSSYVDASGLHTINHQNSGYFKKLVGIGGFSLYANEIINGSKLFQVNYTGNFTGIGGRLGATGVQQNSGKSSLSLYPQGAVVLNYHVPVESYISGNLASSTTGGSLTGLVGPGSGSYHFYQTILAAVSSATVSGTVKIHPPTGSIFTGFVNTTVALKSGVSGNNNYYVFSDVNVFEGSGNFNEFWDIEYNDYDRGLENFTSLGRVHSSGFGQTGIQYRIPSGSVTSGKIKYSSSYSKEIFQRMVLKITDYSSINQSLYIESRGTKP